MKNEYKDLTLQQTKSKIKKELKDLDIKRSEEENTVDWFEFLLSHKGWFMLCHMAHINPFIFRYRMIWTNKYEKCQPKDFVDNVKQLLLH